MGFIPEGAKWYLAELVVAISVGRRKKVTVHVNTVLVGADSPTEAHEKARALGRQEELRYQNAKGEKVRFRFLGLRDLNVIHDELEHGCELVFSESRGKTMSQAKALVPRRSQLGVFAARVPSRAPHYMSGDIRRELEEAMKRRVTKPRARHSRG
jgi:hypothetical protein